MPENEYLGDGTAPFEKIHITGDDIFCRFERFGKEAINQMETSGNTDIGTLRLIPTQPQKLIKRKY